MYCENTITHVIKRGDTIYRLAKAYDTTVPEILMNNPRVNPYNLQVGSSLVICRKEETNDSQMEDSKLNQTLRALWEQLSYWIRMYLVSVSDDMSDGKAVLKRLLQIPEEMEKVFAQYYPPEIVGEMRKALDQFVNGLAALAPLVKSGSAEEADRQEMQLEQAADRLAEILSNMNINYDKEQLREALEEYLLQTKREIVARLSGEFAEDIATFDEVERQALRIADYLARGIVEQRRGAMR